MSRYILGKVKFRSLLETKCSWETYILNELVHDTTRKSENHELIV